MNKIKKFNNVIVGENRRRRMNRINKIVLGFFLFIAIGGLILKITDGLLVDFGYGLDKIMHDNLSLFTKHGKNLPVEWSDPSKINTFHTNFWDNQNVAWLANLTTNPGSDIPLGDPGNEWAVPSLHAMFSRHPNAFWLLTQFTWITTIIVIFFIVFRLFKYESTVPSWLKWIMSQRTLSLITMYDLVVGLVFWSAMFNSFQESFIPGLEKLEYTITVLVHGVVPSFILIYSIIYLINDPKASSLKETFILKGMLYPTIYVCYYVLISLVWNDPYEISNLRYDFINQIWKLPLILVGLWTLLGLMLLAHNFILLRYNKHYDPKNDYEVIRRRNHKIEKLKTKTTRKVEREIRNKKGV